MCKRGNMVRVGVHGRIGPTNAGRTRLANAAKPSKAPARLALQAPALLTRGRSSSERGARLSRASERTRADRRAIQLAPPHQTEGD